MGDSAGRDSDSDSGKLWDNKGVQFEAVSLCVTVFHSNRQLLHFYSCFVITDVFVAFLGN